MSCESLEIFFSPYDQNPIFNVKFSLLSSGYFVITFHAVYKKKYRVTQRLAITNFPKQKYVEPNCEISLKIHDLQLYRKGHTNGPAPYDRMQLILKRPTSSTQISSPTCGFEVPHKYPQHHKLPQKYLPRTSRRIQREFNSETLQSVPKTELRTLKVNW
jgi:hypothetical protein